MSRGNKGKFLDSMSSIRKAMEEMAKIVLKKEYAETGITLKEMYTELNATQPDLVTMDQLSNLINRVRRSTQPPIKGVSIRKIEGTLYMFPNPDDDDEDFLSDDASSSEELEEFITYVNNFLDNLVYLSPSALIEISERKSLDYVRCIRAIANVKKAIKKLED